MEIEKILEELDNLFAQKRIVDAEKFLLSSLRRAEEDDDTTSIITIINELIGLYRSLSRYSDSIVYCDYIISLMKDAGFDGSIHYATTLLNVATAYRASGRLEQSMEYYEEVMDIYGKKLSANDFRIASLYNNMSLLYQELKEYEKACECLENALSIVKTYLNAEVETAVTHSNLAMSLLKLDRIDEALHHIEKSLEIFEHTEPRDLHYASALSAMAEAQFKLKNYDKAIDFYHKSLEELKNNIGENGSYAITCKNLAVAYNEIGEKQEAELYNKKAKEIYDNLNKK